ncbi:uncharacterized protein SAPINGB_P000483 [Magnusiomyces paraingens]|uniref:Uncharacterized protein n=1 Tax=Magnusiomyces paraingens TaxID=2606893 RepID=A0A5E8B0T0_9ASCO|nr:uncharacterized protein SAPINGB_P000483 [Saprochaete ingens]VVT44639.1 unnamed protein product [Saprochaete ingens]
MVAIGKLSMDQQHPTVDTFASVVTWNRHLERISLKKHKRSLSETFSRRFKKLTQESSSKTIQDEDDADDADNDDNDEDDEEEEDDDNDDDDDDGVEDAYQYFHNSNTHVETDNENAHNHQLVLDLYNNEINMHYTNPQFYNTQQSQPQQQQQQQQQQPLFPILSKPDTDPVCSSTFWSREEKNMPMNEKVQKWLRNVYLPGTLVERMDPISRTVRRRVVNPYPGTSDETASESSSDEAREQRKSRLITRQTIRTYRNERPRQQLLNQQLQQQQQQQQGASGGTLDASGVMWSGSGGGSASGNGSGFGARAKRHIRTKAYALACKVIKPPELQTGSSSSAVPPETSFAPDATRYNNNIIGSSNHWPGMSTLNYALGVDGGDVGDSSFLNTSYIAPAPTIVMNSCENNKINEDMNNASDGIMMPLAAQPPGNLPTAKSGGGSSAYCLPKLKASSTFYSSELGTHARRQFEAAP